MLDGNHPLAGMALRLRMKVVDVRAATDAETEARSVGATSPFSLFDVSAAARAGDDDPVH